MNPLLTLSGLWPVVAAGAVGALVPRRDSKLERAAIGLFAALAVALVISMWPGAAASEEPAAEWPLLLNVLIGLPLGGAVAMLFLPRQWPKFLRAFTLAVLIVDLVASLWLLKVPMTRGWHFVYTAPWIPGRRLPCCCVSAISATLAPGIWSGRC